MPTNTRASSTTGKKGSATRSTSAKGAEGRLDPRVYDALFVAPDDLLPGSRRGIEGIEGDDYPEIFETICGATDDSQPVEQYDGTLGVTRAFVDAHQAAVAQVQWNANLASIYTSPGDVNGARWGSGTMIGPDLFLTCGHLFDQTGNGWTRPLVNGSTATISPQEIATNMHLNFNYQVDAAGTLRTEASFPITQLIEYRLGGVDMALCRIGGRPGDTYGWSTVATADVAVGAMLAIIGHPAGRPKRIEAGPATALAGGQLSYNDIDTLGGNSGSGILGPAGTVVGVHTNGGCNPAGTGSNFGVPIATIRAVSPTLQSLGTDTIADTIATNVRADSILTLSRFDDVTFAWRDTITTNVWRDQIATLAWRDTNPADDLLATKPWSDFGGGSSPGEDTIRETIDPGGIGPVVNPDPGVFVGPIKPLRPFALQSGHRFEVAETGVPSGTAADDRAAAEAMLAQYEQAIDTATRQLAALQEEYAQVYADYADTFGAGG
ncbi:MAG TPA: trypsin-like peptidase domain-containing protein [Humibacillus sp.]|nr:trypsin-like peptidase domain-containing protein [Humibacillus sp.]